MSTKQPLRVLVVDDTVVYRKIISDILNDLPDVEIVGAASNGKIALSKLESLRPDLLTLDIEMPEMNGLEVLERLRASDSNVGAIMLSTFTREGGDLTMKALELGAFDFILKPQRDTMEDNRRDLKDKLISITKAFSRRRVIKNILYGKASSGEVEREKKSLPVTDDNHRALKRAIRRQKGEMDIVAFGISTGGPNALARILPAFPSDFGVPILIVQHMPAVFTRSLASSLNAKCRLEVREAADGDQICFNTVFIAPGGTQMKVTPDGDGKRKLIRITDDPPENSCKPSVDYLFRSVAHHYKGRALGVIMTGMGSDGTLGLKLMKRNGCVIIAQNEETCVVYGMPRQPIESGIVDIIAPLDQIPQEICRIAKS